MMENKIRQQNRLSVKTEKKEFVVKELTRLSKLAQGKDYKAINDDSVYSTIVSTFPASVMKYLYENDNDTFSNMMESLDVISYKVGEVFTECNIFFDKNAYLPRFAIKESNYKKLKIAKEKWSDFLLYHKGCGYRFSNQYIGFSDLGANNIRINDFAWYIYTVSNGKYIVVFNEIPSKSGNKGKKCYSQQLWKRNGCSDSIVYEHSSKMTFDVEEINTVFEPVNHDNPSKQKRKTLHAPKIDYIKSAINKHNTGLCGEIAVMEFERKRLKAIGISDEKIGESLKHRSLESDDYGYDIESLDEHGQEIIYIEVKSTSIENGNLEIHISENERRTAIEKGKNYRFYFVYAAQTNSRKIVPYKNLLIGDDAVELTPESYVVTLTPKKKE